VLDRYRLLGLITAVIIDTIRTRMDATADHATPNSASTVTSTAATAPDTSSCTTLGVPR
jgi:citrate synthase